MRLKNRRSYHHGDLRSALIQATIEIINQQGVESITMRRLSEWTGVSRTAAYRHFADKAELLTATAIEGFNRFSQALRAVRLDASVDELTRFRNMGQAYIGFAMENTAYYRLMFGKDVLQNSEALRVASDAAFNELVMMIEQLQHGGRIREDAPMMQAIYIWSLMHGLASLLIDNKLHPHLEIQEVVRFIQQQILRSLSD